jgi:hypothetical protein
MKDIFLLLSNRLEMFYKLAANVKALAKAGNFLFVCLNRCCLKIYCSLIILKLIN